MSVFDQDLGRTVITANVIKDTIAESRKYPDHTISEDELENVVTTVVESIYYRCKAGDIPSDGKWRFPCRLFGVERNDVLDIAIRATFQISKQNAEISSASKIQEEHKRIQDYIQKRFHELGYTTTWNDFYNEITIELPWPIENAGWDSPYNIYSSAIARDLISAATPVSSDINGKLWYMDFPGCDRVDAGDQYDTIDAIDNCSGWIRNSN